MKNNMSNQNWGGIYPSDKIPHAICKKCNYGIIINTETSSEEGEHWVAIFLPKKGKIEYFDSFGRSPSNIDYFTNFLAFNRVKFNGEKLQGDTKKTCGQHCIFFLMCRFIGISFENIINFLKEIIYPPDAFVEIFVDVLKNR